MRSGGPLPEAKGRDEHDVASVVFLCVCFMNLEASVANENEFNADVQWRPQWKFLKGLWFRVRYANVQQVEGPKNSINDFRVIVNYDFNLL